MSITTLARNWANTMAMAVLVVALATSARAQDAGPVVPLPSNDKAALEKFFGAGVVGEPVPAPTMGAEWANLSPGTRRYQLVHGPDAGNMEDHAISHAPRDPSGADWRYAVGQKRVGFLRLVPGESLSMVADEDIDQGVLTRYSPGEPMLIAGMNAGDQRTMNIGVRVYDLSDPTDVEHEGSLTVTYTYVGAYTVTVPGGTFDAALIKWNYKGKVGPASVEDSQYRFVNKDVGMVAMADKRDISAMLIYNDQSRVAKVLAARP
jgi:hypothetical protein